MATLRTGRRYEIVFGPGPVQLSAADAGVIDSAFAQVCSRDANAVVLSAVSDGLRVIGSDMRAAIDAGRDACSIHCRVFDRDSNQEMSSALELSRRPVPAVPTEPVGMFDPRSGARGTGKSRQFKMPGRGPGTNR